MKRILTCSLVLFSLLFMLCYTLYAAEPLYNLAEIAIINGFIANNPDWVVMNEEDVNPPAAWHGIVTWSGEVTNKRVVGLYLSSEQTKMSGTLDLSGLQALTYLFCSRNELSGLLLTGCISLTNLDCSENQITSLDLSPAIQLVSANCKINKMQSIMLNNPALELLDCNNNSLANLDLSLLPNLTRLYLSNNPYLEELIVPEANQITKLYYSASNLRSIDLSRLQGLQTFICTDNLLESLDLAQLHDLEVIDCSHNLIRTLDLTMNSKLEDLECAGNPLQNLLLPDGVSLLVSITPADGGSVMLTEYDHESRTAHLQARSQSAYNFLAWQTSDSIWLSGADNYTVSLTGNVSLTALFAKKTVGLPLCIRVRG